MAEHSPDPTRPEFAWRTLQFCFDFPDPASVRRSSVELEVEELEVASRFVEKSESLARSPFLAHPTRMSVKVDIRDGRQTEEIETDFPNEESERGFLALLRQFAHADETASFKRVQDIAMRTDNSEGSPNGETLRAWGKYHRKLLARTPTAWTYRKVLSNMPEEAIPHQRDPRVDQLLRTYFYGEVIHFGEGRDDLARLSPDAFWAANNRMTLYEGASGLAHFYMGYATVVANIYGLR
jgi:hypothetical protein